MQDKIKALAVTTFILTLTGLLSSCEKQSELAQPSLDETCCQAHQKSYPQGVTIALSDELLHPETPFTFLVTLPSNSQITQARLSGVTMYMGTIPLQFQQVKPNQWLANAMVGACSEPNMVWQLELTVTQQGKAQSIIYPFSVYLP